VSGKPSDEPEPRAVLPTVPGVEAWRTMTADERLAFQLRVLDALSDPLAAMSEGRPHKKAKTRALDALNLHFRTVGRAVYLAEEMAVLYPEEKPFTPDLLAVLDVAEPEDDQRMSWVVADEGKGLDLAIEVLHKGDRDKDLVENVERYAHLGIPEYFVYDRGRQQIHGFRLPEPGARRYQRLVPQLGRYRSSVLGFDLAIQGDMLRFLVGEAELPGSDELIRRLHGMMASIEDRAREAEERIEAAQRQAEDALAAQARAVLVVLRVRGIAVGDAERERILGERDAGRLERWLTRAEVAGSLAEVLSE
jgi:Uma2 family endonuclease